MDLRELSIKLADHEVEGVGFESFLIDSDEQEVLQVVVEGNDELPVFVTRTDEQILCISFLFNKTEVKDGAAAEVNEKMLELNVPVPLSAFSIIADKYAIFGALSVDSSFDDIAHELVTLSDNAIDALEAFEPFLQ
ncbi:YjfI family protein [Algicola sagamiensis]|uniref:YjfI family protein n=1 Tax=Algicola sagamiensis TaxID=163869 RepID=UPI00037EC1F4|nr:DUF2170 family protein [Algicola sagamiensis]